MNETTPKDTVTITVTPETFRVWEGQDRANNPMHWAIHEEMMGRLGASRPKTWIVGGAEYARCQDCGNVIRLNKPLFGSLHLCR